MNNYLDEGMKITGDVLSLSTLIAAFLGALPVVAAALTVVWTVLRIYESWLNIKRLRSEKKNGTNPSS